MRRVVRVPRKAPPLSLGGSYVASNGRSRGVGAVAALDMRRRARPLPMGATVDRSGTTTEWVPPETMVDEGATPAPVVVIGPGSGGGVTPDFPPSFPGQIDTRVNGNSPGVPIIPIPDPGGSGIGGQPPSWNCKAGYTWDGTAGQCVPTSPGPVDPMVIAQAECRAKGLPWFWNGTYCEQQEVQIDPGPRPPPPLPILPPVGPTPDLTPPATSDIPWGWLLLGGAAAYLIFGGKR